MPTVFGVIVYRYIALGVWEEYVVLRLPHVLVIINYHYAINGYRSLCMYCTACIYKRVLKPRSKHVVTEQTLICYGQNKHSHTTAQPGQPLHNQSCSTHMDTEKAFTLPVQLPHTYTTVLYLLHYSYYKPLRQHRQSPPNLNCSFHTDNHAGKFHTARAATLHFLAPKQDWRQDSTSKLHVNY